MIAPTAENKVGDLKVWWIPQIPGKSFEVEVETMQEGKKLMEVLADYDMFQYKNHIKGDYSNMGGLVRCEPDGDNPGQLTWYDIDGSDLWEEWEELNKEGN